MPNRSTRTCPDCGRPILTKGIHRCESCKAKADAAYAERLRQRRPKPRPYVPRAKTETRCPNCGEALSTTGMKKYCSKSCGYEFRDSQRPGATARGYSGRARAIAFGGEYESGITRAALLERDEWTCHICGSPINPDAQPGDWDYGTTDHVTPLCKGGCHTWDNVAAAHLGCNLRKGSKVA